MTATTLPPQPWMELPGVRDILHAYIDAGHSIRFVGGCVRDSLLGYEVHDIDMATDAIPEQGMACLGDAGVRVIPTGLEHGTVTAMIDSKQSVEITTLREDLACDGRHAEVIYSIDWALDAQRRDFTINALSADLSGRIYDYTGGQADIEQGVVRFIGDAGQRVQEDYLRILRFFRFWARYQQGTHADEQAIEACREYADGIAELSGERIQQEMRKLIVAPRFVAALELMEVCHVDVFVFRFTPARKLLRRLLEIDVTGATGWLVRLAALLRQDAINPKWIAERWRLSKADAAVLLFFMHAELIPPDMTHKKLHKLTRGVGKERVMPLLWLSQAAHDGAPDAYATMRQEVMLWEIPVFPVSGRDVMAAGTAEGERVGQLLATLEQLWEESHYTLGKAELLQALGQK